MKSKEVRTLIVYVNIEDELIKNLLTAHGRLAGKGSAGEIIRLSKYIARLSKERGNKPIELFIEEDKK